MITEAALYQLQSEGDDVGVCCSIVGTMCELTVSAAVICQIRDLNLAIYIDSFMNSALLTFNFRYFTCFILQPFYQNVKIVLFCFLRLLKHAGYLYSTSVLLY